jgi:hypothetical protein
MLRSSSAVTICVLALLALGIGGAGIPTAGASQRGASPFTVGERFPDLAFPSLEDGTPTRLSDFRGRKVMLHVFASW